VTRRTKIGLGLVLAMLGLFVTFNGQAALVQSSPNSGEYRVTDPLTIDESSRAVVSEDADLLRGHYRCYSASLIFQFSSAPNDVRVEGVATGSDALFMGIAPADAVARYLDGVTHDEITEWDCFQEEIEIMSYARNEGATDPGAPATESFWAASVSGSGEQTLDWTIEDGDWAVVIMNADGSPGVSADVRFGALAPDLAPLGWAGVAAGLLVLIGGLVVLIGVLRATPPPPDIADRVVRDSSLPAPSNETPGWTLWGHAVLPSTIPGRIAVLVTVFLAIPFFGGDLAGLAIFVALIFVVVAVGKGDRGLSLVLPLIPLVILVMYAAANLGSA